MTIYRKSTDDQNYLHFNSACPSSLKKSIPYSQPLHISNICTETNDMFKQLDELKKAFLKRDYQEKAIDFQFNCRNDRNGSTQTLLNLTYNQTLPNFEEKPIIAYRQNKNLKDIISGTIIEINTVLRNQKRTLKKKLLKTMFLKSKQPLL